MAGDVFRAGDFKMSTPAESTASRSDDPALLRIEGPIATITLNRPAAFNSIDLSIAKKLEQLGAEVEASDTIRVLVIEGEGRAFCAGEAKIIDAMHTDEFRAAVKKFTSKAK
jgi:enoyl-CoA hydratase/carnithine racemase